MSLLRNDEPVTRRVFLYDLEGNLQAADAEPSALADSVEREAPVRSDHRAVAANDCSGGHRIRQIATQKFLRGLLGEEAEVLAFSVRFIEWNIEVPRERVDLGFEESAEREDRAGQLLLREPVEVVALILVGIRRLEEQAALSSVTHALACDARVMPRGDPCATVFPHECEQLPEFNLPVAAYARIRRPPLPVSRKERVDDLPLEFRFQIDYVVRDAERRRHCLRSCRRLCIAALAREHLRESRRQGIAPEREAHPDEIVPLRVEQVGHGARIDASGECDENSHGKYICAPYYRASDRSWDILHLNVYEGRIPPQMTIEHALAYWQEKKLLTPGKAEELRSSLQQAHAEAPSRAISIFSAVGGILIGLGVILFVASNWDELTPVVKIGILMLTMIGTGGIGYTLAYERGSYEKTGLALLFVNVLVFGASIFLIAQIYHLQMNYWLGALLWCLGAAVFAYILQSRLHLWLAVPLLLLFIGWLRTFAVTGFASELDFLFDDRNSLFVLLPTIGAGIVSLGILHRRPAALRFGANTLFYWGVFLVLLTLVISTADKSVFYYFLRFRFDLTNSIVLLLSLIAFGGALLAGTFETKQGRWGLLALGLYLLFLHLLVYVPQWVGFPLNESLHVGFNSYGNYPIVTGFFVIHIVLVFVFLLTVIWYGTVLRMPGIINMAMLGLAVTIIIQYFSWVFEMFDRSIAFILGGLLILALSAALERKRRQLVSSLHA